jgi:hypothetical protein
MIQGDRTSRDDSAFHTTITVIAALAVLCLMGALLFS